jgi:hypothetical protein
MKPQKITIIMIMAFALIGLMAVSANAAFIAVNELGYHPDGYKQALLVFPEGITTVDLVKIPDNQVVKSYTPQYARNYTGQEVSCIATTDCKIILFTDFTTQGTYMLRAGNITSAPFNISRGVYTDAFPVLMEFFNAMLQQNSAYHKDFHSAQTPPFTVMADGSYLMTSGQASTLLIQLGNGYKKNPHIYDSVIKYDIHGNGLPDIYEYTRIYVDYLKGLQGIKIQESSSGFRLDQTYNVQNAFVPGTPGITSTKVYYSETSFAAVPVVSLCNHLSGAAYNACVEHARTVYACEVDEVCGNVTFKGKMGKVEGYEGYQVPFGWYYEWSCDIDVDVTNEMFNEKINPCLIFNSTVKTEYTVAALHGYLQAIPIIHSVSPSEAQDLFRRAYHTYESIKENDMNEIEASHYGASLFLLYEYTGDTYFLEQAHSVLPKLNPNIDLWHTHPNQIYYELYARHAQTMADEGIIGQSAADDRRRYFSDYIYGEYNSKGLHENIGDNAEGITLKYKNYDFSNSRALLLTSLVSSIAEELTPGAFEYHDRVAQNHLGYVNGQNVILPVQMDENDLRSYAFIFGIGTNNPEQYHSRYLINSGVSDMTSGDYIGVRGTGLRIEQANGTVMWMDGVTNVLGHKFGAKGNDYGIKNSAFQDSITYINGKDYIPGWINGPFAFNRGDFMNYHDSWGTYEFTESTDEKAAIAMAVLAHLDARYNARNAIEPIILEVPEGEEDYEITIGSEPEGATVILNGEERGETPLEMDLREGTYNLKLVLDGYNNLTDTIEVDSSDAYEYTMTALEIPDEKYEITINSTPSKAMVYINGTQEKRTPLKLTLDEGTYNISLILEGYENKSRVITVDSDETFHFDMTAIEAPEVKHEITITSDPANATVTIGGAVEGRTPLALNVTEGEHEVTLSKAGYETKSGTINVTRPRTYSFTLSEKDDDAGTVISIESHRSTLPSSAQGSLPLVYELEETVFTINLSGSAEVLWQVIRDGEPYYNETTTAGTTHYFGFTPSIFYSGRTDNKYENTIVKATVKGTATSQAWEYEVRDVFNVFFDPHMGTGSTTTVEVGVHNPKA